MDNRNYHYVSKITLDNTLKKGITLPIDQHILHDYKVIKKFNNYRGYFFTMETIINW